MPLPSLPNNDLLPAIHSMVTLDSPLQGVHNLKTEVGKGLNLGLHWPIAADLNQDFATNRFNRFALGLLATLPSVLTIGNYLDTFVTESDSWIGRYDASGRWAEDRDSWRNKVIWAGTQDEQQLAAYAYTTNRVGPAIQKVTFEFQYPAGTGPWAPVTCDGYSTQRIAGSDTSPGGGGLYRCLPGFSPDPGFLGVPAGARVRVDVAVVTSDGEFRPPDGPRTITVSMGEPPVHPGGVWVQPADGQMIAAAVHFAARLPSAAGRSGHWSRQLHGGPASDPKQWKVVCVATPPSDGSDLFSCDANLQQLGVPLGPIQVSFDVYDVRWITGAIDHLSLAPNGERTVTYAATAPSRIVPGGLWIQPDDGATVGDVIHFAAHAYPIHQGDPAIDHVNFTVGWPASNPAQWRVACIAPPPTSGGDVFSCDANPRNLGVQAGPIRASFDVYDREGNKNSAPNGVHTLTYAP
ncbi:MAG TPA: hypothetical protein VNL71_04880 [Chloroflexota bacterium]|nr:hypothetical protein [Chloroflexota bacterium]